MKKLFRAHDLVSTPVVSGVFSNPYTEIERRPLHSTPELHLLTNSWFETKFGLRFRSKSLFCTGDNLVAYQYCSDSIGLISIKPIGAFQLCFSDRCKDMYHHFKNIPGFPMEKSQVWSELDSLRYQLVKDNSWDAAAESGCEIMLFANEFEYQREIFE